MKKLTAIAILFLILVPFFSSQAFACGGMKDKDGEHIESSE